MYENQKRNCTRKQLNALLNSNEYKQNFSTVKRLYDERTENGHVIEEIEEEELYRADYFDTKFDNIDKQLKKEKQQGASRQRSLHRRPSTTGE